MAKTRLGTHEVELYDSIEALPVARFHRYNKMLLLDAGIGSGIDDFDRHIAKAMAYMAKNDTGKAMAELANLRQCVHMIQQGTSPGHLAFAALVKSVDGVPRDDISDAGLEETAKLLSDARQDETAAALWAAKKKIDTELTAYFPAMFDDAATKEYHDILRRRAIARLREIGGGGAEDRERLDAELLLFSAPREFQGRNNTEVAYDKQFEDMCLLLSREMHVESKEMTVIAYYCALERLQAEAKKARQRLARYK